MKYVSKKHVEKLGRNSLHASKKTNKTVSRTKVAVGFSKTSKRTAQTLAKSQRPAKSGKVVQVAKTSTHGKGYYAPVSKSKQTSTSAKSKNKGYFKPDNSSKVLAKNSGKNKRTVKKKT